VQTLVQVICTPGLSVRDAIANDPKLDAHQFEIVLERKAGRAPGWTTLRSRARVVAVPSTFNGAPQPSPVLPRRNKGSGRPNLIIGDFVDYLLQRHRRRVKVITVLPG
jgi:hypothetical protein